MPLNKGAKVRQVVPVIEGEITERRFNDEADSMEYLVAFTDAEGEPSERWFTEAQLEAA